MEQLLNPPVVYTVEQAAQILQMHPVTVRRKIREGKIHAFMTDGDSGEYRITKQALDAYMWPEPQAAE